ncbi:MAG: hypothetical protein WA994_05660 [Ornithinimicrobium sp.]
MARVTQYFGLQLGQGDVDFVDVDVDGDVPVYIDPTAIRNQQGEWAEECILLLGSFFKELLGAIKQNDTSRLESLIFPLVEPNETHLGDSSGKSRGRSLGSKSKAQELISTLQKSKAVASGFLTDLEDTALMVDGIDKDIISDITTCVIRRQLIDYTQQQARFHNIAMQVQHSGPMWNRETLEWESSLLKLPRAADDKLLLVPRSTVRAKLTVDKGTYYRGFLRPHYEHEELSNPTSAMVRLLKDGERRVNKTKLDEKLGQTKTDIVNQTQAHPDALAKYKNVLGGYDGGVLPSEVLAEKIGADVEALSTIMAELKTIQPGKDAANLYHRTVARILTNLFGTSLGNERIEKGLYGGMKRIDITYDNIASHGLFKWLATHYFCPTIVVECKNYGKDVANPEFDQIAMRFSKSRGNIGLLTCRSFKDKPRALTRARAIADDGNGYVMVLDDEDLSQLFEDLQDAGTDFGERVRFPLLRERFDALIS